MGRIKGVKMTEEAKQAMRAKRAANRLGKENAFVTVWENLKNLSFTELNSLNTEVCRLIEEKREEERQKLLRMKEEIEQKIQNIYQNKQ